MVGGMRCRVAAVLVGAVTMLVACGTRGVTEPTVTTVVRSDVVARILRHCTDLESPDLGEGTVCFDNGFRLRTDDFSFANWGRSARADANVSVQTLIDLFGHGAVCMPDGQVGECTPRPAARQVLVEWNTALAGGRCEGMAALAVRFKMGLDHPSDFAPGAATVAELSRSDGRLESWIAYWWATQFINEIAGHAEKSRSLSPLEIVERLVLGLADRKVGYTLGLYHGTGGHSVVPYAVTRRGRTFVVHVYDNNHPNERREIAVDPDTDRWTYVDAHPGETWSGGTGTFELTRMSARQGPFTCPFCAVPEDGSPTIVTVASRDASAPGHVLVRSDAGRIESTPDGVTSTIEGATVSPVKGDGASLTVSVPASVGSFTVSVRRARSAVPAGDVVVTVRRPGHAGVQVSGDLARVGVDDPDDDPLLRIEARSTTIVAPTSGRVGVSVETGNDIVQRRLRPGETMIVSRPSPDGIEVALKGAGRIEEARVVVPVRTVGTSNDIEVADDGDAVVLAGSVVTPVTVGTRARVNFVPRSEPTTTTVSNSIVVSEPD